MLDTTTPAPPIETETPPPPHRPHRNRFPPPPRPADLVAISHARRHRARHHLGARWARSHNRRLHCGRAREKPGAAFHRRRCRARLELLSRRRCRRRALFWLADRPAWTQEAVLHHAGGLSH